jgi:hypothetical protein
MIVLPQPLPLRARDDWYRREGSSRPTPEGTLTVSVRRLNPDKVNEVARAIIAQASIDFDAKFDARLNAMRLVDAHIGQRLPQVVVNALAAAMSVAGSAARPRQGTDEDLLALAGAKMNRKARVALHSIVRSITTPLSDDARWAITVALDLHDNEAWKKNIRRYRQGVVEATQPEPQPTMRLTDTAVDEDGKVVVVWRERRADERVGLRHTHAFYDAAVEAEAAARAARGNADKQALRYADLAEMVGVPVSAVRKWGMTEKFKMAVSTRAYWLIEQTPLSTESKDVP